MDSGYPKLVLEKSRHYLVKSPGMIELWENIPQHYLVWARNGIRFNAQSEQVTKLDMRAIATGKVFPEMAHDEHQFDVAVSKSPERRECLVQRPDGTQTVQAILIYDDLELA
jgi:hypothetical protein